MTLLFNSINNAVNVVYSVKSVLLFSTTAASKGSEFLPDFNHIFDTAKGILTVVSLIAFISALIAMCFVYYNYNDRQKLKNNPDQYVQIAERLHIEFDKIPEERRADVTFKMLNTRIKTQGIIAVTLVILAIVVGIIMITLNKQNGENLTQERKEKKAEQDSINKVKAAEKLATETKNTEIKKVDQFIQQTDKLLEKVKKGDERAIKVDYHYFLADLAGKLNSPIYKKADSTDVIAILMYDIDHPDPHNAATDQMYATTHLGFIKDKLGLLRENLK